MLERDLQAYRQTKCSWSNCSAVNVEDLDDHCAKISNDLHYKTPESKLTASQNLQLFSEYHSFECLTLLSRQLLVCTAYQPG